MPHAYDSIVPHVVAALAAAAKVGVEARVLAKGGLQSLLVAHYLGHELNAEGQGFDAIDPSGLKYEYKATNPRTPQCLYNFSKSGTIDEAIEKKTSTLFAIVFAIIGPTGVERCHVADARDFETYAKAHFQRIGNDVSVGAPRRGRPRAEGTIESRALRLSEQEFTAIPNARKSVPRV